MDCTSLTEVTLPSGLTRIDSNMFKGCSSLPGINIPVTVTEIGERAFSHCDNLQSVELPAGLQQLGPGAFDFTDLRSITIPAGVTFIASFYQCKNLENVTIQGNLEEIGYYAFFGDEKLTHITLPDSVSLIDNYAFAESGLTEIDLPTGLTSINEGAFARTPLETVEIPDGVKEIRSHAFFSCIHLGQVILHDGLERIESNAFLGTDHLFDIHIPNSVNYIGDDRPFMEPCRVFANAGSYAADWAVQHKWGLTLSNQNGFLIENGILMSYQGTETQIEIPNTVTEIAMNAFAGNFNITSVHIPSSVKKINASAFNACQNLETVIMEDGGVEKIDPDAFLFCISLNNLQLPSGLKYIGDEAFAMCGDLSGVTFPDSLISIGDYAFDGCDNVSGFMQLPNNLLSIGRNNFYGTTELFAVRIPNKVINIGENTFNWSTLAIVDRNTYAMNWAIDNEFFFKIEGEEGLTIVNGTVYFYAGDETTVGIPDIPDIRAVGPRAFQNTSVSDVIVHGNITNFGENAFPANKVKIHTEHGTTADFWAQANGNEIEYLDAGNPFYIDENGKLLTYSGNMAEVVIPAGVTAIADSVFQNHTEIQSVTFPDSLNSIGYRAFYHCDNLATADLPAGLTDLGAGAFDFTSLRSVTIPAGVKFIASFYMCKNLESVTILGNLEEIGYYAFYGDTKLTHIDLPNTVTIIDNYAFAGSGLTNITIPTGLENLNEGVFYGTPLISVTVPGNIKKINAKAFYKCSSLTDVVLSNGLKRIGNSAFMECTNLRNINVPNTVTYIDHQAFARCLALTNIDLPDSIGFIGQGAFWNCTNLSNVRLPATKTQRLEWGLFSGCSSLTSIVIPNNINAIMHQVFENTGLTSIEIPASVIWIGDHVFDGCDNLSGSVELSEDLTHIGEFAFSGAPNLGFVKIPGIDVGFSESSFNWSTLLGVPADSMTLERATWFKNRFLILGSTDPFTIVGSTIYAYVGNDQIVSVSQDAGITKIGAHAFLNTNVTDVYIYGNITEFGDNAIPSNITIHTEFNTKADIWGKSHGNPIVYIGGQQITDYLVIPSALSNIGSYAFYQNGMQSVTIPSNVSMVQAHSFESCGNLVEVIISDGVLSIGENAFANNDNLTKVVIPESVISIDNTAFSNCGSLTQLIVKPDSRAEKWAMDHGFAVYYSLGN